MANTHFDDLEDTVEVIARAESVEPVESPHPVEPSGEENMDVVGMREQIISNATVLFPDCDLPGRLSSPNEYTITLAYNPVGFRYTAQLYRTKDRLYKHTKEVARGDAESTPSEALYQLMHATAAMLHSEGGVWDKDVKKMDGNAGAETCGGRVDMGATEVTTFL